mgnify:CR=1 FL=1
MSNDTWMLLSTLERTLLHAGDSPPESQSEGETFLSSTNTVALAGLLALSGVIARVMPALPVTFIVAPAAVLLARRRALWGTALAALDEIGEHIGSDQARLDVLLAAVADAQPAIEAAWRPVAEAFARLL